MARNKLSVIALTAVLAVIAGVFALNGGCTRKTDQSITIGAVLQLTGENALWGQNAKRAIDLLSREYTQGQTPAIKIVYEDSKGRPQDAVAAFQKLVTLNKAPVVLGDMLTSTTLAMAPIANESKTVLIGISCSSPSVTNAGPYVYRVWPSDLFEGKVAADWTHKQDFSKVVVVYIDNDYGKGLADAFSERFSSLGGKILAKEGFSDGTKDFKAMAARVSSYSPDAVYIVAYYENTALVVRQLREAGLTAQLIGTSSSFHDRFIELAGNAAEGFTCAVLNDFDKNNLSQAQSDFRQRYLNEYKEEPDWAATHGADAFLVAWACLKSGAVSGESIKQCIDTQRSFQGINQSVVFDENGDVIDKPVVIKRVLSGKFSSMN